MTSLEQKTTDRVGNYVALHERVAERCAVQDGAGPDLVASLVKRNILKRTLTDIGPCLTIGPAGVTVYGGPRISAEGAVASAASLAMLRIRLEYKKYTFVRYQWKGKQFTQGSNPALRLGNPTALLMRRPQATLEWQYGARLPRLMKDAAHVHLGFCYCYSTAANGGVSVRRAGDLLRKHNGLLQRESGSVIIGSADAGKFRALLKAENVNYDALVQRCAQGGYASAAAAGAYADLAPALIVEPLWYHPWL